MKHAGMCDPLEEVREAAAKMFEQLHSTIGHQALEDILPFLLKQLVSGSASPLSGGVPPSPWRPHARADSCQGSQCRLQREWVHRMALTLLGVRWGVSGPGRSRLRRRGEERLPDVTPCPSAG